MKKIILVAIVIFCGSFLKAQEKNKQQILELSKDELAKIGVILKNNKIYFNNSLSDKINYSITVEAYSLDYKVSDSIPITNFDFYPYYVTAVDSSVFELILNSGIENDLKFNREFERKLMNNYLVPIRIKNFDIKNSKIEYLFWFKPTESFCKLIPERFKIVNKYVQNEY